MLAVVLAGSPPMIRMVLTISLPLFLPVLLYSCWWMAGAMRSVIRQDGAGWPSYGDGPWGTLVLFGLVLALCSLLGFVILPEYV